MSFLKFLYLFFIFLEVDSILGKKKSANNYFNICSRKDLDISNCIQKTISNAFPQLVKGIPDLRLPSIDPMYISELDMKEGDGNFKFQITMTNVTMTGLKRARVESFRINMKDESEVTMKFTLQTPWVAFDSKYKMGGKVLVIPVSGDGNSFLNFTSVTGQATVKGQVVKNTKDKKDYLSIDSFAWNIDIKGGMAHYTNLFNGDKRLGTTINKFFNDNFMEIWGSLKHLPESAFGYLFKDFSSIIFRSYPLDELLPSMA